MLALKKNSIYVSKFTRKISMDTLNAILLNVTPGEVVSKY